MTAQTLTLTDFLLARIAEDEAVARAARDENPEARWSPERTYDGVYSLSLPSTHPDSDSYGMGGDIRLPREMAKHIARWDPARVLAECDAKRRIVAWQEALDYGGMQDELLGILALPYVVHPDYREEWRP